MDRRAYRYLKDKRSVWLAAIVLALGLILIFIGSRENDGTSGGAVRRSGWRKYAPELRASESVALSFITRPRTVRLTGGSRAL